MRGIWMEVRFVADKVKVRCVDLILTVLYEPINNLIYDNVAKRFYDYINIVIFFLFICIF